jgi:hypothetical protein
MKKVCLTVIGLYLLLLNAFSQAVTKDTAGHAAKEETVEYVDKPLHLEETNIVSSYYTQNRNHSAVTGGIGTEKVTDLSNGLELKFAGANVEGHKYTLTTGLGFDHHSSASSAYVNKTGASKTGGSRVYPSIDFLVENKKSSTFGFGAYYSAEYNYHSFALDANYSHKIGKGGELSGKASAYFDRVKLIYPSELIPATTVVTTVTSASGGGGESYGEDGKVAIPSSPRYTYTGSLAYTQVINKNMQAALLMDVVGQNGYLSLPFHRVYLSDGTVHVENLPVQRYKLPIGFRLNYFAGDKIIIRSYYRYFTDDWGIKAHTASLEVPVKISPFFSISPFYRYYTQTASNYFAPYQQHKTSETYYTSNYAYSAFNSAYYGVGLHIAPPGGLWKSALSSLEIRYGHYTQTTDLNSDIISVNFQFKH